MARRTLDADILPNIRCPVLPVFVNTYYKCGAVFYSCVNTALIKIFGVAYCTVSFFFRELWTRWIIGAIEWKSRNRLVFSRVAIFANVRAPTRRFDVESTRVEKSININSKGHTYSLYLYNVTYGNLCYLEICLGSLLMWHVRGTIGEFFDFIFLDIRLNILKKYVVSPLYIFVKSSFFYIAIIYQMYSVINSMQVR